MAPSYDVSFYAPPLARHSGAERSEEPGMTSLVNLRLGGARRAGEKIEIAALVGLADMLRIHRAIAAQKMRRRRFPIGAAARELFVADVEVDFACRDVDLDLVTGLHQR